MGAQNRVFNVTYKANMYTLTIRYIYSENDTEAAPTVTKQVAYGANYSETSPIITDYNCSSTIVTGIMPAEDKTVTVYYYKDAPVIAVNIEWGDLTFDYTRGAWDPFNHTFGTDTVAPKTSGENTVKVTNTEGSNVNVDVEFTYAPEDQYKSMTGYFTNVNKVEGQKISQATVHKGGSYTAYLWLQGTLDKSHSGTIESGVCQVTIRGGH
jgi:hypothetical protein